jgi:hypothetical protein
MPARRARRRYVARLTQLEALDRPDHRLATAPIDKGESERSVELAAAAIGEVREPAGVGRRLHPPERSWNPGEIRRE